MRVSVVGVGHVGLVTVACLAEWGHEVIGFDTDVRKIDSLREGTVPFFEPGLPELVASGVRAGRIEFTNDARYAFESRDVAFICVGTPPKGDGSPDLSFVQAATGLIAAHATRPVVIVEKSTVPVSTGARIRSTLRLHMQKHRRAFAHEVVSNPEFLREGSAVEDTLNPDRVVVGAESPRGHAA